MSMVRSVELEMASRMEVADAVQMAAETYASLEGLGSDEAHFFALALREALINAIRHGNRGVSRLRVKVRLDSDLGHKLVYTVTDEGAGFDLDGLPDPLAPENLSRGGGRGVFYMQQFADDLHFDFPKAGGTVVRLEKQLPGSGHDPKSR